MLAEPEPLTGVGEPLLPVEETLPEEEELPLDDPLEPSSEEPALACVANGFPPPDVPGELQPAKPSAIATGARRVNHCALDL